MPRSKGQAIVFGALQILVSVHVIAAVNVTKDDHRQHNGYPPRDPDAACGAKRQKKLRDQQGKVVKQTEYFYGFKQYVSLNAATGLITSVTHTAGNQYDVHHVEALITSDLAQGIPVEIVTAAVSRRSAGTPQGRAHVW